MEIYISDESGKKYWRTEVTEGYHEGELNNMRRRLKQIKAGLQAFNFIDAETAKIYIDGKPIYHGGETDIQMSDDELLAALLS